LGQFLPGFAILLAERIPQPTQNLLQAGIGERFGRGFQKLVVRLAKVVGLGHRFLFTQRRVYAGSL
jgi:hypothetical protein